MIKGGGGGDGSASILLTVETQANLDQLRAARAEVSQCDQQIEALNAREGSYAAAQAARIEAMRATGTLTEENIARLHRMGVETGAMESALASETVAKEAETAATVENTAASAENAAAKATETEATLTLDRTQALAFTRVATGLARVEAAGRLSAVGIRGLTTGVADLATGFSAAGPLMAGVAIVGFAMYELFERNKKAIEEEEKAAIKALEHLKTYGADVQLATARYNQQNVADMEKQIAHLNQMRDAYAGMGQAGTGALADVEDQLDELTKRLAIAKRSVTELFASAQVAFRDQAEKDYGSILDTGISKAEQKITKARADARRAQEVGDAEDRRRAKANEEAAWKDYQADLQRRIDLAKRVAGENLKDQSAAVSPILRKDTEFRADLAQSGNEAQFEDRLRQYQKANKASKQFEEQQRRAGELMLEMHKEQNAALDKLNKDQLQKDIDAATAQRAEREDAINKLKPTLAQRVQLERQANVTQAAEVNAAQAADLDRHRKHDAEVQALLSDYSDRALEAMYRANGNNLAAEKVAIDREYQQQLERIAKLGGTEEQLTAMRVAAANERGERVANAEAQAAKKVNDEVQKAHDAQLKAIESNVRNTVNALTRGIQAEERARKEADPKKRQADMVKAEEELGRALLKAMLDPEVKHMEAMATKEFAMAAAAGFFNPVDALRHAAAGAAYTAGAIAISEFEDLGGGGSGGAGGGYGSSSQGTFTPATNDSSAGGGVTLNLITRNPYGRDSIQQTLFEIDRAGILKRQGINIPPTSGITVSNG